MSQLPLFSPSLWTISELTYYLRDLLESDRKLHNLWVQGEVSNLSRPTSGHIYFTLKDQACSLKCVMFRSAAAKQHFVPRDGEAIEVHGSISLYEVSGQYQLYADQMRPAGQGILYQEFLRLKARLEAEGLFAPERKRAIPRWPVRVGIVTSPTGAALRDMLHTLQRRYCRVEVVLAPTPVQGEEAPPRIVAALQSLNRLAQVDVILLARGGGSIEDLWAFNDERVARAIAASTAPIISGVGHETDFTIADFVSDLRAPTPTAAAELATPNRLDLLADLNERTARLQRSMQTVLTQERWRLNRLENRLLLRSPANRLRSDRQRLDELSHRATRSLQHALLLERVQLEGYRQKLQALNPLSVLQRGFALVSKPDGTFVRSVQEVQAGVTLTLRLADGRLEVQVNSVQPDPEGE